jgi:hypothetical protein
VQPSDIWLAVLLPLCLLKLCHLLIFQLLLTLSRSRLILLPAPSMQSMHSRKVKDYIDETKGRANYIRQAESTTEARTQTTTSLNDEAKQGTKARTTTRSMRPTYVNRSTARNQTRPGTQSSENAALVKTQPTPQHRTTQKHDQPHQ